MKRNIVVVGAILVTVIATMVGTMVGLSNTVGDLAVEMNRNHVDAILASADVADESVVSVPILYYDQMMDECVNLYDVSSNELMASRQFEWSECGYYNKALEKELTEPILGSDYLPIARGGTTLSNRGVSGDGFSRWFHAVEGKSQNYASTISLRYDGATASFSYENDKFYPLNNISVPEEPVNRDGNNHLFTLNLGLPIEIMGEGKELFTLAADDDTWVYINDKIVLDMGGVHGVMNGRFKVQENGEVYTAVGDESLAYSGVKLAEGETAIIRIFHADRDSTESVFRLTLSNALLNVVDTVLARSDNNDGADGTTVAYNPEDPGYAAPLGESLTYTPDKSRMILTSVVAQASILGALVVVVMLVISVVWRQARRKSI